MMSRRFGFALGVVLTLVACLDTEVPASVPTPLPPQGIVPPTGRAARRSASAALHLHGWSNHGASTRPASIAWLTQQYSAAGVELLWWTDHAEFYLRRLPDFQVTPIQPRQIALGLWALGIWGYTGDGTVFLQTRGTPVVDSARGRVDILLPAGSTSEVDTLELFFGVLVQSAPRRAALGALSRPLVGQPRFSMSVWPSDSAGRFPDARILVPLAWHPRLGGGWRPVLEYRWGDGPTESPLARGDTVEFRRAYAVGDSAVIVLQPAADVDAFPNGIDNTTDEYRIRFYQVRTSTGAHVRFSFPHVANGVSTAAIQIPPAIEVARAMADAFGVRAILGLEVGPQAGPIAATKWYATSGAGLHMTMLLAGDVSPSIENSPTGLPTAVAARAQSLGGVASIAHPFGTSGRLLNLSEAQQADEARQLGAFLVQNGAWGAPLIEIGLVRRGGVGIRAHLDLLDYLWASGLRLCGTAVTDAHGGLLLPDPPLGSEDDHNFVTWLGDVDRLSDGAALVGAMRSCNLSFGNPFYTRGGMWISTETDTLGRQTLSLDVDGVSPSANLSLYEAEIDSTGIGHDPVYRRRGEAVARGSHTVVGGCRAGFARIEAWVAGRPLAFSNVVALAPVPAMCVTGAR